MSDNATRVATAIINTSVADASITLNNYLQRNALDVLNIIAEIYNQLEKYQIKKKTLSKTCATIGKKALTKLAVELPYQQPPRW